MVMYGFRHVFTLVRQGNDDAIFRHEGAAEGTIKLNKIALHMPRVIPNDKAKIQLFHTIESRKPLSVGFRQHQCDTITVNKSTSFSWKLSCKTSPECPRWVIVGFQTDKANQQLKNAAIFDHCDATNVFL